MELIDQFFTLFFAPSDWTFTAELAIRLLLNLFFVYIIIDKVYSHAFRQKEFYFNFVVTNLLIFFVSSLLASAKIKTGFAFGLFAVFSILRFRTEQMQIRDMTFLFVCIILAVINSLVTDNLPLSAILFSNCVIVGSVFFLERVFVHNPISQLTMIYEDIELIPQGRRQELIDVLRKRTGLDVVGVEVLKINYLQDSAELLVLYKHVS